MTLTTTGLFPGPVIDGRPTWFCRYADVPDGHEWRSTADEPVWFDIGSSTTVSSGRWVLTRERLQGPQPDDVLVIRQPDADHSGVRLTFAEFDHDVAVALAAHPVAQDRMGPLAVDLWRVLERHSTP